MSVHQHFFETCLELRNRIRCSNTDRDCLPYFSTMYRYTEPLLGGSSYIPLFKFLAAKKAIINLKNDDDECFKWAITRALNPVEKKL